jgi:hypothetical protein
MAVHPLEAILAAIGGAGQAAAGIKGREDVQSHEKDVVQLRKEAEADLARQRGDIEMDIEELRQKSAGDREKFSAGIQLYIEQMRLEHNWMIAKGELSLKQAELEWKKTSSDLDRELTRDLKGEELDLMRENIKVERERIEAQYPTSPKRSELYQKMSLGAFDALMNSDNPATAAVNVIPQAYLMAGVVGETELQNELAGAFKLSTGKDLLEFMKSTQIPTEPEKSGSSFRERGRYSYSGPTIDWEAVIKALAPGIEFPEKASPMAPAPLPAGGSNQLTIQQLLELVDKSQQRQIPTGLNPSLTGR